MDATARKIPLDPASFAIWMIGEALGRTWSFALTGRSDLDPFHDAGKGRIYCFWHSQLLPLSFFFRNTGKTAVISGSNDGRKAAAVAQRWGHAIIHGSSTRGGAEAMRLCVRALQQGNNIVITPDGPRGPREVVKSGVAQIAQLSGATVIPVAALPGSSWRLNSWDRFCLPAPFTHIDVRFRDPVDPADFCGEKDPAAAILAAIQKAMDS